MALKPLLLLPGRLCNARLYRSQVVELNRFTETRVVEVTGADNFEELARNILAEAPPCFALAGLSFGGIVALEIARQAPERVERLALLDTNPGGNTPRNIAEFEEQIKQAQAGKESFLELTTGLFYPQMVHPARLCDLELQAEVVAMAREVGPEAFIRQNRALQTRKPRWSDLRRIDCPTLVLSGRQDLVCPLSTQEEIACTIPYARLEIIEECGHLSTLEQPQKVNAALRNWLVAAG